MKISNKIFISIISSILLIFVGMFLESIFDSPIKNLTDKYIFNKEPYVSIAVNHIFRLQNNDFLNFSDLPATKYKLGLMLANKSELGIVVDNENKTVLLTLDDKNIVPFGITPKWHFIFENKTIRQHDCIFVFPFNARFPPRETLQFGVIGYLNKSCIDCYETTFYAKNFGNKKAAFGG